MIAATFSASGLLAVIGLGLLAGTLIGCIGIGGVVLVPALAYLGGVPFPVAIAAALSPTGSSPSRAPDSRTPASKWRRRMF